MTGVLKILGFIHIVEHLQDRILVFGRHVVDLAQEFLYSILPLRKIFLLLRSGGRLTDLLS